MYESGNKEKKIKLKTATMEVTTVSGNKEEKNKIKEDDYGGDALYLLSSLNLINWRKKLL